MNRLMCFVANSLIFLSTLPECIRYFLSINHYRKLQRRKFNRLYKRNRGTGFCKNLAEKSITYPDDIPLTSWKDYEAFIGQIMNGEQNILTKDKVLLLEPTSGTTTHTKYIPYTKGLQEEFSRTIQPWLAGLYLNWPGLISARQYWSISPVFQQQDGPDAKVPMGFEQDSQYLGDKRSRVMSRIMVVPAWVRNLPDSDTWAYVTAFFLLREKHLGLISVWHPSFLTILLEKIKTHFPELLTDIEKGSISILRGLPGFSDIPVKPSQQRARELKTFYPDYKDFFIQIWPRLKVISCWADDLEETNLAGLRIMFPGVFIQPKGLIATEGIVSFPFGRISGLPAFRSHCLEFIDIKSNTLKPLNELELHQDYEPVISTGGGLYRYRMNDLVRVTGFYRKKLPLLQFLHKRDFVSDIRGEKVSLEHVREIHTQLKGTWPKIEFFMLGPVISESRAFYCCYIFSDEIPSIQFEKLSAMVDEHLIKNYHYHYARQLGQLSKPEIFVLEKDPVDDIIAYIESTGTKRGDIKLYALSRIAIWPQILKGRFFRWDD